MSLPAVTDKIQSRHRDRLAIVYVRQSTLQQVGGIRSRPGCNTPWPNAPSSSAGRRERIVVIDDDLGPLRRLGRDPAGLSASGRRGRARPRRPGARGRDVPPRPLLPRLAPAARDLRPVRHAHCRHRRRPTTRRLYNDRLLLGLKGTMSEAELHLLKSRMQAGRQAKAERGELFFNLPRGYVRPPAGEIALDPDEQVQAYDPAGVRPLRAAAHNQWRAASISSAHDIQLALSAPRRRRPRVSWSGTARTATRSRRC